MIGTIIKIIGIILAVVLGILLAILLLVLFVPIGYDASFYNKSNIRIRANGWWLFHGLHFSFNIEGMSFKEGLGVPVVKVRILGIPVLDSSRKKKEKRQKKEDGKETRLSSFPLDEEEKQEDKPQLTAQELSKTEEPQPRKQELSKKTEPKPIEQEFPRKEEPQPTEQELSKKEEAQPAAQEPPRKAEPKPIRQELSKKEKTEPVVSKKKKSSAPKPQKQKRFVGFDFIGKLQGICRAIRRKFEKIKDIRQAILDKLELIRAFFQNEENVHGIKRIFRSIKGLLKHLLPNKIKGSLRFGFDDPCTTGQVLGIMAIFYPYYGKSLTIEPDFNGQVLEGDVYFKGYIQIVTLCRIGIQLIFDANFKILIRNFKKLKEEL